MEVDRKSRITAGNIENIIDKNKVERRGFVSITAKYQTLTVQFEFDSKINSEHTSNIECEIANWDPLSNARRYLSEEGLYLANATVQMPTGPMLESVRQFQLCGDLYEEK